MKWIKTYISKIRSYKTIERSWTKMKVHNKQWRWRMLAQTWERKGGEKFNRPLRRLRPPCKDTRHTIRKIIWLEMILDAGWTFCNDVSVVQNPHEHGNGKCIQRRANSNLTVNIIKKYKLSGHPYNKLMNFVLYGAIYVFFHLKKCVMTLLTPGFTVEFCIIRG